MRTLSHAVLAVAIFVTLVWALAQMVEAQQTSGATLR
jgi:hypothetical protein